MAPAKEYYGDGGKEIKEKSEGVKVQGDVTRICEGVGNYLAPAKECYGQGAWGLRRPRSPGGEETRELKLGVDGQGSLPGGDHVGEVKMGLKKNIQKSILN